MHRDSMLRFHLRSGQPAVGRFVAVLCVALGLAAEPAAAQTAVTVGTAKDPNLAAQIVIAREKGFFKDAGLNATVSYFPSGGDLMAAIVGGIMYLLITVGSLLFGKRLDAKDAYSPKIKPLGMAPVASAMEGHGGLGIAGFAAPGTFIFAMVFLVAFVLYYFVNWKYLSQLWLIG